VTVSVSAAREMSRVERYAPLEAGPCLHYGPGVTFSVRSLDTEYDLLRYSIFLTRAHLRYSLTTLRILIRQALQLMSKDRDEAR